MENSLEILQGEFILTIYKSDSYMVCKFKSEDGPITITGPFFDYEKGQKYILKGEYVDHPKYGFQFNMKVIEKYLPAKKDEIINFLKSKSFKGIGEATAKKVYEHFKDETLLILKDDPSRIFELNLTDKQLMSLKDGFENLNDPKNEIFFNLISKGFNNLDAQKIFNKFKLATIEVGNENPFRYYNEVYGVSFDRVKQYATNIEFDDADNKYKEAYLIHLISDYTFNSGDTYIEEEVLIQYLNKYLLMDNYEEILNRCIEKEYLYKQDNRIYLFNEYNDEFLIANFLKSMPIDLILDDVLIEEGILNSENSLNIEYAELQKKAITSFFKKNISLIVGGPGTGKTTIVKAMVNMFKDYFPYNNLIVVAPTGRAAKRINEMCDVEAKTIHSLLRWNKETNTFVFDEENPIMYDAIIIDEFSMVDNSLFASLLKACRYIKKICIIGDDNQLPSIKPGYVLNDLIESKIFETTYLKTNFRQASGNEIISLSLDVINNDIDLNRYHKDITFYDIKKQNFDLIQLVKNDLNNGYTLDDIQILTPMYKGELGIDNLNLLLQQAFNPPSKNKKEKLSGKYTYRENDKILQLKNRPNDDVYNGDIGILEDVDLNEKSLLVNYQGVYCFYSYDELVDISLAYAMSVHKSQGSEYPIVYFVFTRNNIYMLNKKLIYTAISRAKVKLVMIGEEGIFKQGVSNMMKPRKTTLKQRLLVTVHTHT